MAGNHVARDAVQKIKQLGFKGLQMPHSPHGVRWNSMAYEPVWDAIEESGLPLSFHAGAYKYFVGNGSMGANLTANLVFAFGVMIVIGAGGGLTGAQSRHSGIDSRFTAVTKRCSVGDSVPRSSRTSNV